MAIRGRLVFPAARAVPQAPERLLALHPARDSAIGPTCVLAAAYRRRVCDCPGVFL
jgi:hypothetical protein